MTSSGSLLPKTRRGLPKWARLVLSSAVFLVIALVTCFLVLNRLQPWTGFEGRTLWDWMDLLIVPSVLGLIALWFNKRQKETELIIAENRALLDRQLAADRNQEEVLQQYLDRMTELLLDKQLLSAGSNSRLRAIAEARTDTALRMLNGQRKGNAPHKHAQCEGKENSVSRSHPCPPQGP